MARQEQWQQDRAIRDIAKGLVTRDIANLRGDVDEQGVGSRMVLRMREGAEGLADDAQMLVRDHPRRTGSAVALGLGLFLVWVFSDRIAGWLERLWGVTDHDDSAQEASQQGDDTEQATPQKH